MVQPRPAERRGEGGSEGAREDAMLSMGRLDARLCPALLREEEEEEAGEAGGG